MTPGSDNPSPAFDAGKEFGRELVRQSAADWPDSTVRNYLEPSLRAQVWRLSESERTPYILGAQIGLEEALDERRTARDTTVNRPADSGTGVQSDASTNELRAVYDRAVRLVTNRPPAIERKRRSHARKPREASDKGVSE